MPSEYQKWIARNEKPQEKRELTREEKWKNWLYYHKWHIVAVIAAVVCLISIISSNINGRLTRPDIQIAYIGTRALPEDTVIALEEALSVYAEDITGDGVAKVGIRQYLLGDDMTVFVQLEADLSTGESRFFLMEDPKDFQTQYEALAYADGTFGTDVQREEPLWYAWGDCPTLAKLDLGSYVNSIGQTGSSQDLLSKLSIGRRGTESAYQHPDLDNRFWSSLLAGMEAE